jgi:hypothetical protein
VLLDFESGQLTLEEQIQLLTGVYTDAFWPRLPIYLVWVGGLVVAWRRRKLHPRVSFLVSVALVLFLLDSLVGFFLGSVLAAVSRHQDWDRKINGLVTKIIDVGENCFVAFLWVLMLRATFRGRERPPETNAASGAPAAPSPQ